ncbi:hypothetical protein FOXYS1_5087 [Fusarium oxysporum]|uniref:Uncharacterized protein n=1 Tax=Fusarium oxysporum TaxID=5507 RepID=A0A8H5EKI9_FUSOX|nr:hypothetical protein FOXYS1_5087 [Fusarium oxysporum]
MPLHYCGSTQPYTALGHVSRALGVSLFSIPSTLQNAPCTSFEKEMCKITGFDEYPQRAGEKWQGHWFWNSETGRKELFWSNELVRDFLEGGGAVGAESLNDVSGQYNAVRDVKLSQEGNSEVIVIDDDDDDDDQDFMDWEGNDAPGQSPAPCREQFNHHSLTPPFSNTPQSAIPADDSMLLDPMIPLEVQAFRNETQKIATKLANDRRDFQAQVSVAGH